jgi:hypothetical protein
MLTANVIAFRGERFHNSRCSSMSLQTSPKSCPQFKRRHLIGSLAVNKRSGRSTFASRAFADFEDEYVALDLPHIPEPTRSEMTKELELRFQQLQMLLQAFHTE